MRQNADELYKAMEGLGSGSQVGANPVPGIPKTEYKEPSFDAAAATPEAKSNRTGTEVSVVPLALVNEYAVAPEQWSSANGPWRPPAPPTRQDRKARRHLGLLVAGVASIVVIPRGIISVSRNPTRRPSCGSCEAFARWHEESAGGSFLYGDKKEPRTVAPFAMDVPEVTVAAYRTCVSAGRCTEPSTTRFSWLWFRHRFSQCNWKEVGKDDHPVNCVDWEQATTFCAWAGKRLPDSERSGSAPQEGRTDARIRGVMRNRATSFAGIGGSGGRHLSRWKLPHTGNSPFGLMDIQGNVQEWTSSFEGTGRGICGWAWYTACLPYRH